jgi:hypothetical protein
MAPLGNIAGGVFNPTARPFALDGAMFVDNGLPGRLAIALLSLLVVASALKWLMNSFHGTVYWTERLAARTPSGKGVALALALGLELALRLELPLGVALGQGSGPVSE